jgi:hypothetical protein
VQHDPNPIFGQCPRNTPRKSDMPPYPKKTQTTGCETNLVPFSDTALQQLRPPPPRRNPRRRFCYTHRRLESALTKTRGMLGKAVKVRHCPATVSDGNRLRRSLHPVGRPRNPETGTSRCRKVRRPVPR